MSQILDEQIVGEVTDAVRARLGEWVSGAELAESTPTLRKYPHSFMLRYPLRGSRDVPALLVKFVRKDGMKALAEAVSAVELRARAKGEFDILLRTAQLIEAANDPGCSALRPFAYLEQWNVMVMPEIPGGRLKDFYLRTAIGLRNSAAWEELLNLLRYSGRWLRIYHTLPEGPKFERFPKDKFMGLVEERLQAIHKYSHSKIDVNPVRNAFLECMPRVEESQVEVSYRHGDFTFSNILVTNTGRACAIDMSKNQMDPIYLDLGYLIIDPSMRMVNALSGGLYATKAGLERCRQAIVDGYFGSSDYNRSALAICCAFAALNKWSADEKKYHFNRSSGRVGKILLQLARPYFRNQVYSYLSEI